MADNPLDVEKLATEAMEIFKKNFDESFDKDKVKDMIKTRILEEQRHFVELRKLGEKPDYQAVENAVGALLSPDQIQNIKTGFQFETFTMKVQRSHVDVLRKENVFMEAIKLDSSEAILSATGLQIASFVVEMVLFILSVIGTRVNINDAEMRGIIDGVRPLVQNRAYQRIIDAFVRSWNEGNVLQKATAIFIFLKDTYSFGILMNIINMVIANMTFFEKARALAEISAMLIITFATEGVAIIAKIVLAINDAVKIVVKVVNFGKLKEMHAQFK